MRQKVGFGDLHNDPSVLRMIEYGGPLLCHRREDEERSFDSTCPKFCRFLTRVAC
jgi:hypothetical protein